MEIVWRLQKVMLLRGMENDDLDNIERLLALKADGSLSTAEFQTEKARILGRTPEVYQSAPLFASIDAHPTEDKNSPLQTRRSNRAIPFLAALILLALLIAMWIHWSNGSINHSGPAAAYQSSEALGVASSPVVAAANQQKTSSYDWATSTETLNVTPAFLELKLGAAQKKGDGFIEFEVSGCNIRYNYTKSSVDYFDAEVNANCKPSLRGLDISSYINFSHSPSISEISRNVSGLLIADCLEMCGNAADPAQYLFIEGPHSDNFINVALEVDQKSAGNLVNWANAIRTTKGLKSDDEVPDQSYQCGTDAQDGALQAVGGSHVARALVGQGLTMKLLTTCGTP
jgi:hypothetical protein